MAELFENGANPLDAAAESSIQVEMLDYTYVKDCEDYKQLNGILQLLKSGKEGYYPDLIKFTEEQMLSCMPPKEKKKYLSFQQKASPGEVSDALHDVLKWQTEVRRKDSTVGIQKHQKACIPVRGSTGEVPVENEGPVSVIALPEAVGLHLNKNQLAKIKATQSTLKVGNLSETQRLKKAINERIKGNESFKVSDNDDALTCYTRSIAYDASDAKVFANRAMVYIRMELFDLAEDDSSAAIKLDPTYVKAYSRRGTVRFKRGKYAEAIQDFERALEMEPGSVELAKLLEKAKTKHSDVEGINMEDSQQKQSLSVSSPVPIPVEAVESFQSLFVGSSAGDLALIEEGVAARISSSFQRVRILVESDSDSDSGDDNDSDSESDSDVEEIMINATSKEGEDKDLKDSHTEKFKRIAITDDDDEDDDDEEEEEDKNDEAGQDTFSMEEEKENGNNFMQQGMFKEAIECYNNCLHVDPTYLPALNNRSQAYLSLKDYEIVISDTSLVIEKLDPKNLKALQRRAAAHYHLGHFEQATKDALALLAEDGGNERALAILKSIEGSTAKNQKEIKSTTTKPVQIQEESGSVIEITKEEISKRSSMDSPSEQNIEESNVLKERGNTAVGRKDFATAHMLYSSAIQLDPNNFAAYSNRSLVSLKLKKFHDAVADATMVIDNDLGDQLGSQNGDNFNGRGEVSMGRLKKCVFRRGQALHQLAKTGVNAQSSASAAVSDLDLLLKLDPTNEFAEAERKLIKNSFPSNTTIVSAGAGAGIAEPVTKKGDASLSPASVSSDVGMTTLSSRRIVKTADKMDSEVLPPPPPTHPQAVNEHPAYTTLPLSPLPKAVKTAASKVTEKGELSSPSPSSSVKAAASGSTTSPVMKMAVPTEPPKTVYEFERVWRGLKNDPASFMEYLALFKKSTYKRVVKETTSNDLLGSMLQAIRDHSPSVKCTVNALEGMSEVSGFELIFSLLAEKDMKCIKSIFDSIRHTEEMKTLPKKLARLENAYLSS